MIEMCTAQVADLKTGCYETMAPCMAVRLESRPQQDNPSLQEYWVFLRDDLFWQPLNPSHFPDSLKLAPHFLERHPVTAHDFKFFYNAIMNPYIHEAKAASLRTYYNDIEEFRVVDDHTFVVRWNIAEGRPESRKRVTLGVVLQTGSTPRAARVSVLSTTSTCHPLRALTISFWPLRLVRPAYHASVPRSY